MWVVLNHSLSLPSSSRLRDLREGLEMYFRRGIEPAEAFIPEIDTCAEDSIPML